LQNILNNKQPCYYNCCIKVTTETKAIAFHTGLIFDFSEGA